MSSYPGAQPAADPMAVAYQYVADEMVRGVTDYDIQQALVAQGWDWGTAQSLVASVRQHLPADPAASAHGVAPQQPAAPVANYYTPTVYNPAVHGKTKKKRDDAYTGGGGSGGRNMLVGGVICVIGIVVTVGTYMAAADGGRFTVAWGAILFGGIQFFKGMAQAASGD
ncbi:MAG TPA: hypothetical protein VF796_25080 [Humisphaera sp.]